MTTVAIHQPQYLSYLGFFHKILHCDIFVALDNVQFQKNGVQNRNKIRTAQGWQWITVPVRHHFGQLINEVQLDNQSGWPRKHWNAIQTSYARAPYFDRFGGELKALLLDREYANLSDLNMALTDWALKSIGITTPIEYASKLNVPGEQTDRLINICKALNADRYLSGQGGKHYMDIAAFDAAGIAVEFQEFISPRYLQVFPETEFVPDISVVDALLCHGPAVIELIR
jgi:hypothetical protein